MKLTIRLKENGLVFNLQIVNKVFLFDYYNLLLFKCCCSLSISFFKENFSRDESIFIDLTKFIISAGPMGVTLQDIQDAFSSTHLEARSAGRYAVKMKLASTVMVEKNKTKVNR